MRDVDKKRDNDRSPIFQWSRTWRQGVSIGTRSRKRKGGTRMASIAEHEVVLIADSVFLEGARLRWTALA